MENVYLNKILNMVNEINDIDDKNVKIEKIYQLSSYSSFVYYSGYITQKEYINVINMIKDDPEEKIYEEEKESCVNELIKNNNILKTFYKKYIDLYNNTFIPKDNDDFYDISIYKLFREFLRYMNIEKLYFSLLSKNRINFNSILDHGICINDRYDSYILINDCDRFNRYFSMSHEMAHAFENKVTGEYKTYFASTYNAEIISILFNRIFKEFIIQSKLLSEEQINSLNNKFEANYYNFLLQAIFITEIVTSGKYTLFDYEINLHSKNIIINCNLTDHNYAIGSVISLYLLNDWRKNDRLFIKCLPELIKLLHFMKVDELIKCFDNEEKIKKEIKNLIKK